MAKKDCKHGVKTSECTEGCNPSHPAFLAKKVKDVVDNKMTQKEQDRQEKINENLKRTDGYGHWKKK